MKSIADAIFIKLYFSEQNTQESDTLVEGPGLLLLIFKAKLKEWSLCILKDLVLGLQ